MKKTGERGESEERIKQFDEGIKPLARDVDYGHIKRKANPQSDYGQVHRVIKATKDQSKR